MRGWLVYTKERLERNEAYARMHERWCDARGVDLRVLLVERMQYGLGPEGIWYTYDGKPLELPNFAIFRCEESDLRRTLELCGVVVANGSCVGRIANDKLRTYELAHELGIPYLEVFSLGAARANDDLLPLVIKPRGGHGGEGVRLIRNMAELDAFVASHVASPDERSWLCQRVAPVVGQDLRVYVLGRAVVAAMLRTAPDGGFLSNYCRGGSASAYELSPAEEEQVLRIADALGEGYYGIDFLFGEDGSLLLNEVEDVVGSRMLYAQTNIDVVDRHLSFVVAQCEQRVPDATGEDKTCVQA